MLHVLTPIRKTETCAGDLTGQTVECKRFTHFCDLERPNENEAYNRNQLKKYASEPYTLLLDADVILTDPQTVEKMVAFLDKHPFAAVAVDTKEREGGSLARLSDVGHTIIACLMVRKSVLDSLTFGPLDLVYNHPDLAGDVYLRGYPIAQACCCVQVNAQIRTMTGFPIPYLKNTKAKEAKNGSLS